MRVQVKDDRGGMLRILGYGNTTMALLILLTIVTSDGYAGLSPEGESPRITPDGCVAIEDGTVIPPFQNPGKWTELERKSSDRYAVHQFMYLVPGASPAIEIYITMDRSDEAPDGIFETGLVGGYVKGLASKAGLKYPEPAFEERRIGRARVRRALVNLSDDRRSVWVYTYIFVRKPSLTFIAVRTKNTESASIEDYLAGFELK
jgi:hypothetical protein